MDQLKQAESEKMAQEQEWYEIKSNFEKQLEEIRKQYETKLLLKQNGPDESFPGEVVNEQMKVKMGLEGELSKVQSEKDKLVNELKDKERMVKQYFDEIKALKEQLSVMSR